MKLSFHEMASAQICNVEFYPGVFCLRTSASPHQHVGWQKNGSIRFDTQAAPNTASTGIAVGSDKPALSASDNSTVAEPGSPALR